MEDTISTFEDISTMKGYYEHCGGYSALGRDAISIVEGCYQYCGGMLRDAIRIMEDTQCCGGYSVVEGCCQYCGRLASVLWWIFSTVEGYYQYC